MCIAVGTRLFLTTEQGEQVTETTTVYHVSKPCTCPNFVRSLNGDNTPSAEHYHFRCEAENGDKDHGYNGYYLAEDGTLKSVWAGKNDFILNMLPPVPRIIQTSLF